MDYIQSEVLKCFLRGEPFFSNQSLTLVSFVRGEVIIREGEPARVFHLICRGRVQLVKQHPDGQRYRTTTLSRGSSVGLPAVLADAAYTTTAQALTSVQTYPINQDILQAFLASHPAYYSSLTQQLARTLLHYEKLMT